MLKCLITNIIAITISSKCTLECSIEQYKPLCYIPREKKVIESIKTSLVWLTVPMKKYFVLSLKTDKSIKLGDQTTFTPDILIQRMSKCNWIEIFLFFKVIKSTICYSKNSFIIPIWSLFLILPVFNGLFLLSWLCW